MSVLELTIDQKYAPNWQVFDGIRELVQNCKDGDTCGHTMQVTYNKSRSQPTLQLINQGTQLEKSSLLLGGTDKRNNPNLIGFHGEGLKIAFLTLLKHGFDLWIRTGYEKWIPRIEHSQTYGAELLKVEVTKSQTFEPDLKVEVRGLVENDWFAIKERFLFSPFVQLGSNECIELGRSKILTAEKYRGHLFVKGIWVCDLPGKYWFGYDLEDLKLDRDRKLVDPFNLKWNIRTVLEDAARQDKLSSEDLYTLFQGDSWEESRIIIDMGDYGTEFLAAKVTEHFRKLNGDESNVVAVDSMQDSINVQHFGLKGVVVAKPIKRLVEQKEGKLEDKRQQKALDIKQRYGAESLSQEEVTNFSWAVDLLHRIQIDHPISVVDFCGVSVLGTFKEGEISISKNILLDRKELIATVIHELFLGS